MELESLVPILTSNETKELKITTTTPYENYPGWSSFDGLPTSPGWYWTSGKGQGKVNAITITFKDVVELREFVIYKHSYGTGDITQIIVTVDGKQQSFATNIKWNTTVDNRTHKFKLTQPLRGKSITLTFTSTSESTCIEQITLLGFKSGKVLVEMNGKLYSVVNEKLTLVEETNNTSIELFQEYGIKINDIISYMSLIKNIDESFKIHTLY